MFCLMVPIGKIHSFTTHYTISQTLNKIQTHVGFINSANVQSTPAPLRKAMPLKLGHSLFCAESICFTPCNPADTIRGSLG